MLLREPRIYSFLGLGKYLNFVLDLACKDLSWSIGSLEFPVLEMTLILGGEISILEGHIGDALSIDVSGYDTLVFAPPLSQGCSGRREDSLSLDRVTPSYEDFLEAYKNFKGIKVLVLPGRTLSLREDRDKLHKLLSGIEHYDVVPLRKRIVKYVDIYIN